MNVSQRSLALLLSVAALMSCEPAAETFDQAQVDADVDALFSEFDSTSPGCAIAVDLNKQIVHLSAYGIGDFEQKVLLSTQSVFYAASVSKQVVAMAAVLLDREGKIDLDADIHQYIPEFQDYGTKLTVRQILHHVSGIRDYFNLFALGGRLEGLVVKEDNVMALLARQKALNFTPGEQWAYSNSAYFLISQVVKRVTGEDLDVYAQEEIFEPLGMNNSRFQHNHLRPIPGKAHGYSKQKNGEWFIADSLLDVVGSGGMYTTVEDLIKWDRNFYDNQLGTGQDIVDEMQTSGILNDGEPTQYGLALNLRPYKGLARVSHGGSLTGYRAILQRFPDQKFSVALLCNSSAVNSQSLANKVTDIYLSSHYEDWEEEATDTEETIAYTAPAELNLGQYRGNYYSDEVENTIAIILSEDGDGILFPMYDNETWKLSEDDVFKHPDALLFVEFGRGANGLIDRFTYNGTRVMGVTFDKQ